MLYNFNVNASLSIPSDDLFVLPAVATENISLGSAIYTLMVLVPANLWDRAAITYGYNRKMEMLEILEAYQSPAFPPGDLSVQLLH